MNRDGSNKQKSLLHEDASMLNTSGCESASFHPFPTLLITMFPAFDSLNCSRLHGLKKKSVKRIFKKIKAML